MGAFDGIKVLELGAGAAGPVATRYLADQGATVLRVESTKRPDFLRTLTQTKNSDAELDSAPMFVLLNANKLSVSINMSTVEGIELVKRLVLWADVVSENFSPKAMAKWGLDYPRLRELKPDLIMVSSCLFGQTGPQRMYPGFGGQGSALSGFNHLTGWPDREAVGPYATITDSLSPKYVALSLIAALFHRDRTGEGQYIDLSQIEAAVYSLSEMVARQSARGESVTRMGNRSEFAVPHGIYPCRGVDRWIAIAVHTDADWKALVRFMGNPDWVLNVEFETLAGRRRNEDMIEERLRVWTTDYDAHELMQRLQDSGIEAGAVQNFQDLNGDPQLEHREHFQSLDHVHLGTLRFEHSAIRHRSSSAELRRPGPCLGEHNEMVLGEILGLSQTEIQRMIATEVIA